MHFTYVNKSYLGFAWISFLLSSMGPKSKKSKAGSVTGPMHGAESKLRQRLGEYLWIIHKNSIERNLDEHLALDITTCIGQIVSSHLYQIIHPLCKSDEVIII